MLCFDHVICYFYQGNKRENIRYNMNYMKVLKSSRDDSLP